MRSLKDLKTVGIFTCGYLVISAFFSLTSRNWEFVYYSATVFVFIALAVSVYLKRGLSHPVLWSLSVWGLLHMCGGLVPVPQSWPINGDTRVLYSLWLIPGFLKYDHVIHAYGFGTCVFVCFQAVRADLSKRKHVPALVLSALAALGLGAVNEMLEFFAVLLIPDTNVGGYMNTGWDLVANTAGAVIAAVICYFQLKSEKPKPRLMRMNPFRRR